MTTRNRKTPEQMIAGLERKLQAVKSKAKNMERQKQTRRAVILGMTIQAMADTGDPDAKRMTEKVLAGLTRKQDRLAFDLEPLPEQGPDDQPAANPLPSNPLAVAEARRLQALKAWDDDKSELNRVGLGEAIAACERLTGKCWEQLASDQRAGWGLTDRPGELARAS
jgi:hypothetical protein